MAPRASLSGKGWCVTKMSMTDSPTLHKRSSRLLLDEKPLIVLPHLAIKIGLSESIILQQLHYWLTENPHWLDNRPWVYNTYDDWQKQFPFWSVSGVRKFIARLEERGLILSSEGYNVDKRDRTKWYTIDYDALDAIADASAPVGQSRVSQRDRRIVHAGTDVQYTETTSETTQREITRAARAERTTPAKSRRQTLTDRVYGDPYFVEFWSTYPRKADKPGAGAAWHKIVLAPELTTEMRAALYREIMTGLDRWLTSAQWQDEQYIPYPGKWLNHERWKEQPRPREAIGRVERTRDVADGAMRILFGDDASDDVIDVEGNER